MVDNRHPLGLANGGATKGWPPLTRSMAWREYASPSYMVKPGWARA